jgi:hypothetical protein
VRSDQLTWGRSGFDGGRGSQDACRAPPTRKSGGKQPNCGFAARSRGLDRERLPVLACGAGSGVISRIGTGSCATEGLEPKSSRRWPDAGFQPFSNAPGETSRGDTHVEVRGAVLSDAGSIPAASTTLAAPLGRLVRCRRRNQPQRSGPSDLALGVDSLHRRSRHRFARLAFSDTAVASLGSPPPTHRHRFARLAFADNTAIASLGSPSPTTPPSLRSARLRRQHRHRFARLAFTDNTAIASLGSTSPRPPPSLRSAALVAGRTPPLRSRVQFRRCARRGGAGSRFAAAEDRRRGQRRGRLPKSVPLISRVTQAKCQ